MCTSRITILTVIALGSFVPAPTDRQCSTLDSWSAGNVWWGLSPYTTCRYVIPKQKSNVVMAEGGLGSASVGDSVVTEDCLQELLDFFAKSAYRAKTVDRRVSTLTLLKA